MLEGVRRSFHRGVELLSTGVKKVGLCEDDILITPSFTFRGGQIHSTAEDSFGLYAAAFAIRWCRNCANFLAAADAVAEHRLYSSVVLLSYASAFQTLHAYLSLNGCVVIDPAFAGEESTSAEPARPVAVVGRLTKDGEWKFEGARRSHQSRWNELQRIWRNSSARRPAAFDELFSYFFRDRWKVPLTLDGLTARLRGDENAPQAIPWRMDEKMKEFLAEIAEVRHEAQYFGFGADAGAFDAMINGEGGPYPLHLRSDAMKAFASSFATDVVHDLVRLIEPIRHSKVAREGIRILTFFPVHDNQHLAQVAHDELHKALVELDDLLAPDAA